MSARMKHNVDGSSCRTAVVDRVVRIYDVEAPDLLSAIALLRVIDARHPYVPKIGPIGIDTWSDYRAVTYSDGSPSFPGEPQNPDWMAKAWWNAGFGVVQEYSSAIDLDPRALDRAREPRDVQIDTWAALGSSYLLLQLHEIAEKAFAKAPYFSPVKSEEFAAKFGKILEGPAAETSYVAFKDGAPVGFLLGYPDGRGGLVLKTLVSSVRGVGGYLTDRFYRDAVAGNAKHVIHALMHGDNASNRMSAKFGTKTFRRYALFGKDLSPNYHSQSVF